jgi:hypothetical protein
MQRVLEAVVVLLFPIRLRRHKQAIGDANETRAIAARTIEKAKRGRDAVGRLRSGKQRAQAPFVDEILRRLVWSKGVSQTPGCSHGEISTAGTRTPRRSKANS